MIYSSYSIMRDIRKLDDAGQLEACRKFHQLIHEKPLRGDFIDRFEETYSLLDEDDWEFTSDNLHYVINDLDNALYSIDYNAPMLFAEVYKALSPAVEESIQHK